MPNMPIALRIGVILMGAVGVTVGILINVVGSLACLHLWPIVAAVALCFAPMPNLVFGFSKIEPNIFGMEQMATFAFLGNFISGGILVSGYAFPLFARNLEFFLFQNKPYGWDLNEINPYINLNNYGIFGVSYLFWIATVLGYIGATICYVSIILVVIVWTKFTGSDDDDDLF